MVELTPFTEFVARPLKEHLDVRYGKRVDDAATLADLAGFVRLEALGRASLSHDGECNSGTTNMGPMCQGYWALWQCCSANN